MNMKQKEQSNTNLEESKKIKLSIAERNSVDLPVLAEKVSQGKTYVSYGVDNKFPNDLWDLYLKSSVLQACVNGTADYSFGQGIGEIGENIINNDEDTLDDLIKKSIFDYVMFGGFAVQGILNKITNKYEYYWVDVRRIRCDADGKYVYYSDKWGKYGCEAIKYERFNSKIKQDNFIYYFTGHITRDIYPIPRYIGSLASIATSAEIGNYHLNAIINNFDPSAVINFNNGIPDEDTKKDIENMINNKFSGTSNARRLMVSFNDSKDVATTIEKLDSGNEDQKFQTLQKSTMTDIFISFRATPALFGLNPENNGFSKQEFLESFELYNETVIKPIQKDIKRCFKKLMDIDINIIPFELKVKE